MFDPETAKLLRSAPEFEGLDPENLPKLLTDHYAKIIAVRLGGEKIPEENSWTLDRIADTYELVASVSNDLSIKRSSAFVAASAQQLIARREKLLAEKSTNLNSISRDRLSPEISAILLFLISEQYADAHEAGSNVEIEKNEQHELVIELVESIIDLAKGHLSKIISKSGKRVVGTLPKDDSLESTAFLVMIQSLIVGIENLAKAIMGEGERTFQLSKEIFENVKSLSAHIDNDMLSCNIEFTFPGIFHLSSLLITVHDCLLESSLVRLKSPSDFGHVFWQNWIQFRAKKFPYLWVNHREALSKGFHHNGTSAVMVLPTGAGKTTISSIKIASVLSQGKKVVFLAPTHALVEQLTVDLREIFPKDILRANVSSDFDLLFRTGAVLSEIEVMTPERCLATLSFSPKAFDDVGLLVFDECHILCPQSEKIRRSLDSMLCLLTFNRVAPNADMLFLSAMVKNGKEFSDWICQLTGRSCISIDLLWKPSRQARGVVIYSEDEINVVKNQAMVVQKRLDREKGKVAKGLRTAADNELSVKPYAIWGLQYNWLYLDENKAACTFTQLINETVLLTGKLKSNRLDLTPNANNIASVLAVTSAKNNLKTIVFVNQKSHAVSTARSISQTLGGDIIPTSEEKRLWDALELELGDLKHSLLIKGSSAVPHNASMLRLERDIAERIYKRADGAMVIVATPTLAQGLNLPAQIAILAGDKRADNDGRELLEAHELLNAAGRAGRAGHLANGIVLLIPEPILTFPKNKKLNKYVVQKLQSLIPEDDRCIEISDPISKVLDEVSHGNIVERDVMYLINRLSMQNDPQDETDSVLDLNRSFAAFQANTKESKQKFDIQLAELTNLIKDQNNDEIDIYLAQLASQSGLPPLTLSRLKAAISQQIGNLPISIVEWGLWLLNWLKSDTDSRDLLLYDVKLSILGATGRKKEDEVTDDVLDVVFNGVKAWLTGLPLRDVEIALGGDPESGMQTNQSCPRARELVTVVLPRGLSFIIGLVSRIVTDLDPYDNQESLLPGIVDNLSTAIRLGYDSPEKITFAIENPKILSRVGVHQAFMKKQNDI